MKQTNVTLPWLLSQAFTSIEKENYVTLLQLGLFFSVLPMVLMTAFTYFFEIGALQPMELWTIPIVIVVVVAIILSVLYPAAVLRMFVLSKKNKKPTLQAILKDGYRFLWSYLGLSILWGIIIILLFLALIIPGIIASVFWTFWFVALITDDVKPMQTLKASYRLVKGQWWRTFGYVLVATLVFGGITILAVIPASIGGFFLQLAGYDLASSLLSVIAQSGIGIFVTPLSMKYMYALYNGYKSAQNHSLDR